MGFEVIVNDNFQRANADPIGGIYSTLNGFDAIQIVSDAAQGTVASVNNGVADTANAYLNDQWAGGVLAGTPNSGSVFRLLLRITNPTTSSIAYIKISPTAGSLTVNLGTSSTTLTSFTLNTTPAAADVYLAAVQGQTYTFSQNGVLVGTYVDTSSHAKTGVPGFGFVSGTNLSNPSYSAYSAGNYVLDGANLNVRGPGVSPGS